ncbi:MAG: DUF1573 domain-containing protein [Bacteroidota bacterium]
MIFRYGSLAGLAAAGMLACAQPALEIEGGNKIEFGTVHRGSVVERKVILRNTGDETLVIGRIDASCGCTGTVLSSKEIRPGETGSVLISFNSRSFSGAVRKSVTVNSNAAAAPASVIEFTATVVEELSLDPTHIWFRDAKVGILSTASVTVRNNSSQGITLTGSETRLEGFSLKLPAGEIPAGKTARITAEFTPRTARPVLSDGVFLYTSSKSQPQIYIQIFGNVKEFKFE